MKKGQSAAKTYDIVGKTFNNIKVLEFNHIKDKRTYFKVLCLRCDTISLMRSDRFNGLQKLECCSNCRQDYAIEKSKERASNNVVFKKVLNSYKANAKKRNIEFNLTDQEVEKIINENCKYCGIEPQETISSKSTNRTIIPFKNNGIDRIDNTKGYTLDNVVSCCKTCNVMKNNLKLDDFLNHVRKIVRFND